MKHLTLLLIIIAIAVPVLAAAPLQEGLTDNSSIVLSYTGTWSTVSEAAAFGGSFASTVDYSAVLSWQTYATGMNLYYMLSSGGGQMELCVDTDCQTISTDGSTAQATLAVTGMPDGLKTITLGKLLDDGLAINFDAVYIYPSQPAGETPSHQIVSEFEYGSITYSGVYDLSITAGEVVIILLLTMLIIVQIGQLIAEVHRE